MAETAPANLYPIAIAAKNQNPKVNHVASRPARALAKLANMV
jgi:hypothetical protein